MPPITRRRPGSAGVPLFLYGGHLENPPDLSISEYVVFSDARRDGPTSRAEPTDNHWGGNGYNRIEWLHSAGNLEGIDFFSHLRFCFFSTSFGEGYLPRKASSAGKYELYAGVGIFAQRPRAGRIGLGCRLCGCVAVGTNAPPWEGLDAIDGTPVLDISGVSGISGPSRKSSAGVGDGVG